MKPELTLLTALVIMTGFCCGAEREPRPDQKELAVYLVLEGEPTAQTARRHQSLPDRAAAKAAVKRREDEIKMRQDELEKKLAELGIRPSGRFHKLANVVRVQVGPDKLPELKTLPGVVRVEPVPTYTLQTSTSVPFIGAPAVWRGLLATNVTGEGIRIGIIDTGIDYLHADFGGSGNPQTYANNNSTVIEPGTFPTTKVAGGYDFAGDNYTGTNAPVPDPDPLDCAQSGHGSHVAGIAAGFGVLTNGTTYSGAYTQGMAAAQFIIGPGVAPRAKLYAIKIFGCTGSTQLVLDGLEWAADPNNDGDFSDRLDVVNLSLGAPFGFTGSGDPDQDAVNRLVDLGCVVVAASGNTGNVLYSASTPALAEKCIAVGNSIDAGSNLAVRVLSPQSIAGLYEAVEGLFTRPLSRTGPLQGRLVYVNPPLVCAPILNAAELSGNIALMDRGTCMFVDKFRRLQAAGAIAGIVVNNVPGPPVAMGGTALDVVIPGVMISQSDGEILKTQLGSNPVVRLDAAAVFPRSLADQIDTSSSRGPASPSNLLKPEIVAPGNSITSARAGSGTNSLTLEGTSMSTPHVTGAAALLRQIHPHWPVEEIKAALMNTAKTTRDGNGVPYPESWTGAGRVQVDQAARAGVTAKAIDSDGLVALSFGSLVLTNVYREIRYVLLTNQSAIAVTYSLAVSNTVSENGFSLLPLTNSVTVPANGSALAAVQLIADPAMFDRSGDLVSPLLINGLRRNVLYEASGQIWFQNTNLSIHLPYYCNLRAGSSFHAVGAQVGLSSSSNVVAVAIPVAGHSTHPEPLVSVFQLGTMSPSQNLSEPWRAAADLIATGAASDAPDQAQFSNSTVYFGIATAGNWTTPHSFVAQYEVLIDANRDGTDDYRIFNSSLGNATNFITEPNSASDVFLAVAQNIASGLYFTNNFVNYFGADVRDTAPFNNSVLVLPVPVSLIGLTAANSGFNYRVRSRTPRERGALIQETTPTVFYDALRPALGTTAHGISTTPFHHDGQPIAIDVDRSGAAAQGYSATNGPSLLLLHHFNVSGQRVDMVNIELAAIEITAVQLVNRDIRLAFTTVAGKSYRLERSEDLAGSIWATAVDDISGTGGIVQVTDAGAASQPKRFYRVRLIP